MVVQRWKIEWPWHEIYFISTPTKVSHNQLVVGKTLMKQSLKVIVPLKTFSKSVPDKNNGLTFGEVKSDFI